MAPQKFLALINPIAGLGRAKRIKTILENRIDRQNIMLDFEETNHRHHGREIVEQQFDNYDGFIAIGGDGTVNEIGSALINSGKIMAIIPAGSGNGLARHLGISMNVSKAIGLLNKLNSVEIDVGQIGNRYFFCTAGNGFDGYIAHLFDKANMRGFWGYAQLMAQEYAKFVPTSTKIEVGGETLESKDLAFTIANAGQYGNNAWISPLSSIRDGKLELVRVKKFPIHQAGGFIAQAMVKQTHKSVYFSSQTFTEATIQDGSKKFHLDGEPAIFDFPVEVKVLPSALRVVCDAVDI